MVLLERLAQIFIANIEASCSKERLAFFIARGLTVRKRDEKSIGARSNPGDRSAFQPRADLAPSFSGGADMDGFIKEKRAWARKRRDRKAFAEGAGVEDRHLFSAVCVTGSIILTIILIVFCLLSGKAHADVIDMSVIAKIESSGRPDAYNARSGARGLYQITPICLQEWNNFHPKDKHTLDDLFHPDTNTKIATWFMLIRIPQMLRYYGVPVTIENMIVAWNAGIVYARRGVVPTETANFIKKYRRMA